jgi:hypothetical protein
VVVDVGEHGQFDDVAFVVAFYSLNGGLDALLMGLQADAGIFGQDLLLGWS